MREDIEINVRASAVASAISGTLHGADCSITGVCTLNLPERGKLCFAQALDVLGKSDVSSFGAIVIAPHDAEGLTGTWIGVENPRLAFARVVAELLVPKPVAEIAKSASIHPTARLAKDVSLGEGCVIGAFVTIGEGTWLAHHVVLGQAVHVGRRCKIGSNTVIGEEGFGLAKDGDGPYVRIPHLGSVVISDDVQIGALSSIAAGTIEPTMIGQGARIDDQVFIAHNCLIGENVMIISCAQISGSVTIGRNSWIGPNATIRDKVSIPADTLIGMGAVVTKSLDEPGTYAGSPARLLSPSK